MNITKEIKNSPFVPPIKKYYLGWIKHFTPYFEPIGFCDTIIKIRKLKPLSKEQLDKNAERGYGWAKEKYSNLPMVRRSKNWIISFLGADYYIRVGTPIKIHIRDIGWKEKWNSPRFECNPSFQIWFFKWQFTINWVSPFRDEDEYWEMVLWWLYFSDKDIVKAENSWGWADYETKKSTWNKKYLKTLIK